MGFWSEFGKWGARIGGYALAPVTGGYSIPIGESIAQGIGTHQATEQANQQLQQGVQRAEGAMQQAYAPYLNLGAQSANTLAGLMGFSPAPLAAGPSAPDPRVQQAAEGTADALKRTVIPWMQGEPRSDSEGLAGVARPRMQTQSSYGTVRMRAPTGEESDVDPSEVPFFERAGARRVRG